MATHDPVPQHLYASQYSSVVQHYTGAPVTVVAPANHQQQQQQQVYQQQQQQQQWPRPGQYPSYPYCGGATAAAAAAYMPAGQYQSSGGAPVGLHGGAVPGGMGLGPGTGQNAGYYQNFQTRLQAMASQSIAKDNPHVIIAATRWSSFFFFFSFN